MFLTAHDDPDFLDAAESVGASGYVLKHNLSRIWSGPCGTRCA